MRGDWGRTPYTMSSSCSWWEVGLGGGLEGWVELEWISFFPSTDVFFLFLLCLSHFLSSFLCFGVVRFVLVLLGIRTKGRLAQQHIDLLLDPILIVGRVGIGALLIDQATDIDEGIDKIE